MGEKDGWLGEKEVDQGPGPLVGSPNTAIFWLTPEEGLLSQKIIGLGQQTHEMILNITHYQRNANQNHNEVPSHAGQNGCYPKVYKQ